MNTKLISAIAATFAMGVYAGGAHAVYCAPSGTNSDGMSVSDVTFDGAVTSTNPNGDATDCYGILSGNDSLAGLNTLMWGNDWVGRVKNEILEDTATLNIGGTPYTFTLSLTRDVAAGTDPESGYWDLTITPLAAGATLYFDFAVALKGPNADGLGYWFFDEAKIVANPTDGTYVYKLAVNTNPDPDQFQDLSHMSVYVRDGRTPDDPGGDPEDPDDPGAVPEPGVLFLMGAGLLGLGMARRRKSA